MTDRQLIAYLLIALMIAGFAALVWWRRYHSFPQTHARQQERQRLRSEARALARLAEGGDGP